MPNLLRSFRHRNFALFFSGQIVSLIGTWMQSVAESWLVYRLTKSSALLGTVAFAALVPSFVLSPFGGLVADRFDKRRVLVLTQSIAMTLALILSALTITGVVRVWHLITLATLLGIVNAFDIPTRQAFVVEMVGREDLTNAIALNSMMFNGARVVGPAIAGIVVAAIGEGWCFFANAISYIAVIAGLLLMKLRPATRKRSEESALQRIVEGFRFARTTPPIRALLLLIGAVSLVPASARCAGRSRWRRAAASADWGDGSRSRRCPSAWRSSPSASRDSSGFRRRSSSVSAAR
jgi:MFS family permease